MSYKTPNVYVEERSLLPPSVAARSTAVPAFLGCTETGYTLGSITPVRINHMLEYEQIFGGPEETWFTAVVERVGSETLFRGLAGVPEPSFLMHPGLKLYFDNGGGPCYIVSVGSYVIWPGVSDYQAGLDALAAEEEPTLILPLDAVLLADDDYNSVCNAVMDHGAAKKDRFGLFDIQNTGNDDVAAFRNGITTSALSYGAVYHPWLQSTGAYTYSDTSVTVWDVADQGSLEIGDALVVTHTGPPASQRAVVLQTGISEPGFVVMSNFLQIEVTGAESGSDLAALWDQYQEDRHGFDLVEGPNPEGHPLETGPPQALVFETTTLDALLTGASPDTALYNQIKAAIETQRMVLPPSPAVTGIYCRVDAKKGVWKPPANESLTSVIRPVVRIDDRAQEDLNEPADGKAVNVIRSFTGRGNLVWGARTLDGNSNEWRYISVRRLFIYVEDAVKQATNWAVFEPNNAATWINLKTMIQGFLNGLWEQGALAGNTAAEAYYVKVGLDETMTQTDVDAGLLKVDAGLAAARPAEFIVLRFSHKLQQT